MFTEVANNIWVDKETGNHICSDNYVLEKNKQIHWETQNIS